MSIKLEMCWSSCPGADGTSLVDDLNGETGGGTGTATGHTGIVNAHVYVELKGGTPDQKKKVGDCLKNDKSWQDHPPANRPGATTNQQTEAQKIVDACCPPAGTVKVCIPDAVGQAAGPDGKPPCKAGYVMFDSPTTTEPPPDETPEGADGETEPQHNGVQVGGPGGRFRIHVQNTTGGAGQIFDFYDTWFSEENDHIFDVLHYLFVDGQPLRLEDHFDVTFMETYPGGYMVQLQAVSGVLSDDWTAQVQAEITSEGLTVTVTHQVGSFGFGEVTPAVYLDIEADHNHDENMITFDGIAFHQASEEQPMGGFMIQTSEMGSYMAEQSPVVMMMMDEAGILENTLHPGPADLTLGIAGHPHPGVPGEVISFSYSITRPVGRTADIMPEAGEKLILKR